MAKLSGVAQRCLQPKLRMVRNGDTVVNAIRSEHSPSVAVSESVTAGLGIEALRGDQCVPVTEARRRPSKGKRPGAGRTTDSTVSVFVDSEVSIGIGRRRGTCGGQTIAELTLAELDTLANDPRVTNIELGESVSLPDPVEGDTLATGPGASARAVKKFASEHRYGEDVLVGIIDVGGFDFAHPDFLRDGKTRFERIWD